MKKIDYSKYTREDLENIAEKQALEIEKLKENSKADDKRIDKLEGIIKKMEQEKKDWFEIDKNADAYATAKQFQDLKRQRDEYQRLYEETRKSKSEAIAKFQEKLENTREKIHNERGAGRKGFSEEIIRSVIELKTLQSELSSRKISEILKEQGISMSHNKVNEILKNNEKKRTNKVLFLLTLGSCQ